MSKEPTFALDLQRELDAIVQPLRAKRTELDAQIETMHAQITTLRAARTRIDRTLASIAGGANGAKPKQPGRIAAHRARQEEALRVYVSEHADELADGFTLTRLMLQAKEHGIEPAIGAKNLEPIIEKWHAAGIVRAERKVRGGGVLYRLVQRGDDGTA